MEKKQIKINGKIAVEIKINGGLFWKAGGPEPTEPNKLVYSTNAEGSEITVNGETIVLRQGENITLEYPIEITSVTATNNTALTAITIPNTVTEIKGNTASPYQPNSAFYKCTSLVSVTLPDTITSIGKDAFGNCTSLVSINIPNSVTSIGNYAVGGTALTSITIPNSVTSFGERVFAGCEKLGSVTLPDTVTSIGYRTFYNCTTLSDLNYIGTMSQWSSITLAENWNEGAAIKVVHCTDGDVNII